MITHGYITLAELKSTLNDPLNALNNVYERAIEAASRAIDHYCDPEGHRHFWSETSAVARVYQACDPCELRVDDFHTLTGLVVKTDDDDDGTYETTWTEGTDFQAEPVRRRAGWPYERIGVLGSKRFSTDGRRARVQVTAQYGWVAIPKEVEQACQILSIDNYRSKDLVAGAAGFTEFGTAVRALPFSRQAAHMLDPLRTTAVLIA